MDELACKEFLGKDACVILHVCRRRHIGCEFVDIHLSAYILEGAVALELFGDGDEVDRTLIDTQRLYGSKYLLVARLVEGLRTKDFADDSECVLVDHERAKYGAFGLHRLWRHVT